ncbi:hypothetical protein PSEUDO8AS_30290 [Pseudomonas sp. 8AS]|nr:hypothetical protein PSEUDO8AS_30290 [Pseudomonas sp. 8AS]
MSMPWDSSRNLSGLTGLPPMPAAPMGGSFRGCDGAVISAFVLPKDESAFGGCEFIRNGDDSVAPAFANEFAPTEALRSASAQLAGLSSGCILRPAQHGSRSGGPRLIAQNISAGSRVRRLFRQTGDPMPCTCLALRQPRSLR